jgi:hypothetical protein
VSSTTDFARDATTSYSRKRGLYPDKEWHKHLPHKVMASYLGAFQIHRVAAHQVADQGEHHHISVPQLEEEICRRVPKALPQRVTSSSYCLLYPSPFILLTTMPGYRAYLAILIPEHMCLKYFEIIR